MRPQGIICPRGFSFYTISPNIGGESINYFIQFHCILFHFSFAIRRQFDYLFLMDAIATKQNKPKNPFRISLRTLAEEQGFSDTMEFIGTLDDSIVPACCSQGCEVEPDGRCEHGCPSALIAAGFI